jgi:undecaprenyl-diphosphatase
VAIETWLRGKSLNPTITWNIAIAVGVAQLIAAMFPGTSRSGASIVACLLLGLARPQATEFSFLVGIPTMLAAGAWEILKALKAMRHHTSEAPPENWGMVLLGFIVAAIVSFIAVKWLLRYIQTHTFVAFGWYRIALAIVIAVILFASR